MKVLSLFDGISCARVALERAGIPVETYYASEIDKYAMQISAKNYPDIVQMGDVTKVLDVGFGVHFTEKYGDIDLLIGGSPCQDLSIAKKDRKGLDGDRSGLFWEYVRILNEVKPKYFILENVNSMPKEAKALITKTLGVEPIMIDAALVSAQRRKRLFWTNIPNVGQPEDRGILLKDILEDGDVDEKFNVSERHANAMANTRKSKKLNIPDLNAKCGTITASHYKIPNDGNYILKDKSNIIRTGGRGSGAGDKHDWESVYQYRRTYWRETKGGKVPTLTANMGTGGNNVPYVKSGLIFVGGIEGRDLAKDGKKLSRNYPQGRRVYSAEGKATALSAGGVGSLGGATGLYEVPVALRNRGEGKKPEYNNTGKANALTTVQTDSMVDIPPIRKLTCVECERLQSLPDNYTEGVSNTQRYRSLGNAFNVEVVAHILKYIC